MSAASLLFQANPNIHTCIWREVSYSSMAVWKSDEGRAAQMVPDLTVIHVIQASTAIQYGISIEQRLSAHKKWLHVRDTRIPFNNIPTAYCLNDYNHLYYCNELGIFCMPKVTADMTVYLWPSYAARNYGNLSFYGLTTYNCFCLSGQNTGNTKKYFSVSIRIVLTFSQTYTVI